MAPAVSDRPDAPLPVTVNVGASITCTATASYSNGTGNVVTATWTSSNTTVATVSGKHDHRRQFHVCYDRHAGHAHRQLYRQQRDEDRNGDGHGESRRQSVVHQRRKRHRCPVMWGDEYGNVWAWRLHHRRRRCTLHRHQQQYRRCRGERRRHVVDHYRRGDGDGKHCRQRRNRHHGNDCPGQSVKPERLPRRARVQAAAKVFCR